MAETATCLASDMQVVRALGGAGVHTGAVRLGVGLQAINALAATAFALPVQLFTAGSPATFPGLLLHVPGGPFEFILPAVLLARRFLAVGRHRRHTLA